MAFEIGRDFEGILAVSLHPRASASMPQGIQALIGDWHALEIAKAYSVAVHGIGKVAEGLGEV